MKEMISLKLSTGELDKAEREEILISLIVSAVYSSPSDIPGTKCGRL